MKIKIAAAFVFAILACSVSAKEVSGGGCRFNIPEDVNFMKTPGVDNSFVFQWGAKEQVAMLVFTKLPRKLTDEMMKQTAGMIEKNLVEKAGSSTGLKAVNHSSKQITVGGFDGYQIECSVKSLKDKTYTIYVFLLKNDSFSCTVELTGRSEDDLKKGLSILKSTVIALPKGEGTGK